MTNYDYEFSTTFSIPIEQTSTEENVQVAESSSLQIFPNPFKLAQISRSHLVTFKLYLKSSSSSDIKVGIYNLKGQKLKTYFIQPSIEDEITLTWDGRDFANKAVSAGIYYCILEENGRIVDSNKLILLK